MGFGGPDVNHNLISLKGVILEIISGTGVMKGDTRSLDYGSCEGFRVSR